MTKSRWLFTGLLATGLGVTATLAGEAAGQAMLSLTQGGQPTSVIVYPRGDALLARTAEKLSGYLHEHTGARVPAFTEDQFKPAGNGTAVIVLDGTADHRLAGRFGTNIRLSAGHPDAYQIKIVTGAAPRAILAGKSSSGVKFAAYRLMRELDINGQQARIGALDVAAEPFIKTRSVALFNVWNMPIEVTRRHNVESWDPSRLTSYIDMYDFYGFNAIESHDRFDDGYLQPLFGLKRTDWSRKVLLMCDEAHRNGQEFFLRVWGHTVMNTPPMTEPKGPNASVPKRLTHLCVNDPSERKRWETEIRDYYVRNYAGRIDHLIGHWVDPGICLKNGCDYKVPLRLQTELHRAFKAVDPKFKSTFSLWFFDRAKGNPKAWARGGWAGYNNDNDLIGSGILDKDIRVATYTTNPGPYKPEVVQSIIHHGYKPAVWTWYRADHETKPSLHVHAYSFLSDYFKGLPASARQLEWHNVERNVHGAANTVNYYVAGRLMWEPARNPDDLLREFTTLVFGRANGANVLPAYHAIARIRCHACAEGKFYTGLGTDDPARDVRTAEAALARLAEIRIDPAFRPRIPTDIAPAAIVADLKASLEVMRDYARLRADVLPKFQRAVAAKDGTTARRIEEDIRQKYGQWRYTIAGRQEWALLERLFGDKDATAEP